MPKKKSPRAGAGRFKPGPHPVRKLTPDAAGHLRRVRRICLGFPGAIEKISHGEPTFFARNGVFAMFSNHHHDGPLAVWIPAAPGLQEALVHSAPGVYFRPPYVGVSGWVGIELAEIGDEDLAAHITEAWQLIEAKRKKPASRRK